MEKKHSWCRVLTLFLCISLITACKKDSNDHDPIPTIKTLEAASITNASCSVSGSVLSNYSSVFEVGVCYSTTSNPSINNNAVKATNNYVDFTINLTNLNANTTYYAKAYAKYKGGVAYGNEINFKTNSISIDYSKFYDLSNVSYFYNSHQLFSVEDGVHKIYGKGFTLAPVIVKMYEKGNNSNVITPAVTVLNDSILTFKIPNNLFGQVPYVPTREYAFTINDKLFASMYSFINHSTTDTAYLVVANRKININYVNKITMGGCDFYSIKGSLGSSCNKGWSQSPDTLLGVLTKPAKMELTLKAGGIFYKTYDVAFSGSPACGIVVILSAPYNNSIYIFHEPVQVTLKDNLPSGQLSVQITNTMSDGTVFKSNEFTFTN